MLSCDANMKRSRFRLVGRQHSDPAVHEMPDEEANAVEERLRDEADPDKRYVLRSLLAGALAYAGRIDEAKALYLALHAERPDKPRSLISLAEKLLYAAEQPEMALPVIDQAIEVAFRTGDFRRNALGVKARIALALERYDLVEEVMRRILPLKTARAHVDCGIERDFLDRLPPGAIDEEVRRQYAELRRGYDTWFEESERRRAQNKEAPSL
jgi:tetratricopeptide (TPR) repeat protein